MGPLPVTASRSWECEGRALASASVAWDRYLSQENYCEAVFEALDAGEIPAWQGD